MDKMKIFDCCQQIRGVSYKPNDIRKDLTNESVMLLRANNIANGKINFDDVVFVDKKCVSDNQYLRRGDILICTSSGSKNLVGKAAAVNFDGEYTFGAFCKIIRPRKINADFLAQYFQSPIYHHIITSLSQGANINNIRNEHIDNLELPIFSSEEEKSVIVRLQTMDTISVNLRHQLTKLEQLVKSRFIEMFGDINTNDRNWLVKPLGKLCNIYRGGSPRPINQFLGGDVPWIKIGDATKGDEIYLHSTKEHIISDGVKKSRMVKKGSLIFANCGVSLGFARIITFDGCIHDGWLSFEDIDESIDKVFLLLSLNQMTEHFRTIAPEGTQPNLNTAIMKAHPQIIPPIDLQRKFIEFIQQADKSELAIRELLERHELMKAALMQRYFG